MDAVEGETGAATDAGGALLLVGNPTSGRGRAGRWIERARRELERAAIDHVVATARGEAAELIAKEPDRFREHWVFGGDGTVADLANALAHRHAAESRPPRAPPRIALFPTGTGNVVARDLGVPLDFDGALAVARGGVLRPFDLGRLDGRRFAFMVSAGLDAELARWVADRRRGPMRRTDWIRAALACPRFAREAPLDVIADGRQLGSFRFAAVFNCGLYAGGFRVCPRARFDDGCFELLLLREPIRPRWKRVVWAAFRHRPESLPDATLLSATRIELRGVACSQVDGDPGPAGDLSLSIEPAALSVRAPFSSGRSPSPG